MGKQSPPNTHHERVNSFAAQHGEFSERRVDERGPKIQVNTAATPLDDCLRCGKINGKQYAAGRQFEHMYNSYLMSINAPMSGRDSCDFSVRGGTGETPAEWILRCKERYYEVRDALPLPILVTLCSILVRHEATGDRRDKYKRWSQFIEGLDELVRLYKM